MKNTLFFLPLIPVLLTSSACVPFVAGTAATTGVVVAQERSMGQAVDDTTIWTKIKNHYLQHDVNDLLTGVNVEVIEGRVHLTGKVHKPKSRIDAVRLAWKPEGVKEVINEIQITDQTTIGDYANDKWILTQLNSKLLVTEGIRSLNYSTEVVNGIIYLMGIAQNQEELNKVISIARRIKGVKEVVSHVRMKDNT